MDTAAAERQLLCWTFICSASFLDSGLHGLDPLLGPCLHIPLPFLRILYIIRSSAGQRASNEVNVEIFLFKVLVTKEMLGNIKFCSV